VILCEAHPDGVVFSVKAHAGAKRNELSGVKDGILKVSVTQAPEKGKANRAIVAILCKRLLLRKAQLDIIAGETARRKRFLARDITPEELTRRVEQALTEG